MALSRIEGNPPCRMVRPWGFMQAWKPAPHRRTMRQGGFWFAFPRLGKDALISNDGTHTPTAVTVAVAVPVGVARTDVEAVGVGRVFRVLSGRPIFPVLISVVEAAAPAVANSGQEDAIAINFAGELCAVHAIEHCPFARAVVKQLLDIIQGGHTPVATPLYMGNVVIRAADI